MLIQHAAMPHSVFRSLVPMIALGAGGLPEPNFDRFASPWTCFADAGAGGDGGDGGTGGAGDAGAGGKPDKTFTQAEFNSHLASARKAFERDAEKKMADAIAAQKAELEALKIQLEESGKSSAEKERLAADRARAAIERDLDAERKARAADAAALAQSKMQLRETTLGYELSGLFAAKKAAPESLQDAVDLFKLRAKIEYDEDGKVVGVDYGSGRYETVEKAVDAFWKDRGATFSAAPAGGAGMRLGNANLGNKPLTEMSDDDLIQQANQRRNASR